MVTTELPTSGSTLSLVLNGDHIDPFERGAQLDSQLIAVARKAFAQIELSPYVDWEVLKTDVHCVAIFQLLEK